MLVHLAKIAGMVAQLTAAGLAVRVAGAQPTSPPLRFSQELRIDGVKENLAPLSWIAVRTDGVIAIYQEFDKNIRFYGPDGVRRGTFGRAGDGPGEFRTVSSAGWVGDTLWVADMFRRRTVFVSPRNALMRDVEAGGVHPRPADTALYVPSASLKLLGVYGDGRMLLRAAASVIRDRTDPRTTATQYVIASSTGEIESIPILIENPKSGVEIQNTGHAIPFVGQSVSDVSPDGSRVVSVSAMPQRGTGGVFKVSVHTPLGKPIWTKDIPITAERISSTSVDSAITVAFNECQRRPAFITNTCAAYRSTIREHIPTVYPPVRSIIAGRDGSVWVALRRTAQGQPWLVFDAIGTVVGSLTVPRNVKLLVVEQSRVWASEADSDGVESIIRLEVRR